MSAKWDQRFLKLAEHISGWSKDPSTKVGCVVVGEDREIRSTGFNGFPRGIADDSDRLSDRDKKYPLICHAEENAIMHAARIGLSLKGCTAYVTWPPCTRCPFFDSSRCRRSGLSTRERSSRALDGRLRNVVNDDG